MINEGPLGSICFYLNGELIQSCPMYEEDDVETLKNNAYRVIIQGMKQNCDIKFLKKKFWIATNNFRKVSDLTDDDILLFAVSFFGLMKLNSIQEDAIHEGIHCFPRKKKKKKSNPSNPLVTQ